MSTMGDALKRAGSYVLTDHAKDRIRQRIGILSEDAQLAWVETQVKKASHRKQDGHKTHYTAGSFEIVCDGVKVVTVKPTEQSNEYLTKFNDVIAKETRKLLTQYGRELRKAEISVAETQLNFLRARNPKTKALISERLTKAIDWKCALEDEIKKIRKAAERYGVQI